MKREKRAYKNSSGSGGRGEHRYVSIQIFSTVLMNLTDNAGRAFLTFEGDIFSRKRARARTVLVSPETIERYWRLADTLFRRDIFHA